MRRQTMYSGTKAKRTKNILNNFNNPDTEGLDEMIHENALYAKKVIQEWVDENDIDLIIAHNTSHPYKFYYCRRVWGIILRNYALRELSGRN